MKWNEVAADAAGISVANKTLATGATTSFLGFISSINWLGIFGILIALMGFVANIYFQLRRDKREAAESRARLAALEGKCEP